MWHSKFTIGLYSSALDQCSNIIEKTGLERADPTVAFYPTQQLSTGVIGINYPNYHTNDDRP